MSNQKKKRHDYVLALAGAWIGILAACVVAKALDCQPGPMGVVLMASLVAFGAWKAWRWL